MRETEITDWVKSRLGLVVAAMDAMGPEYELERGHSTVYTEHAFSGEPIIVKLSVMTLAEHNAIQSIEDSINDTRFEIARSKIRAMQSNGCRLQELELLMQRMIRFETVADECDAGDGES